MNSSPTDLVVFGVGQLGQLFAGGALRLGVRVTPITRSTDRPAVWSALPPDTPILIAVREADLADAIADVPEARRGDLILVQNELFEPLWTDLGAEDPTVVVFWTNKKPRVPLLIGRRTALHGRHADFMAAVHAQLDILAEVLSEPEARDDELVAKYAFILTINALGLIEDTTVGAWLEKDRERVTAVLDDAIQLGERYAGRACRRERALAGALAGMTGMGSLKAKGRSAPSRLRRALSDAEEAGLELPALTAIHHELEEGDS